MLLADLYTAWDYSRLFGMQVARVGQGCVCVCVGVGVGGSCMAVGGSFGQFVLLHTGCPCWCGDGCQLHHLLATFSKLTKDQTRGEIQSCCCMAPACLPDKLKGI